jgi:hypothetical protein
MNQMIQLWLSKRKWSPVQTRTHVIASLLVVLAVACVGTIQTNRKQAQIYCKSPWRLAKKFKRVQSYRKSPQVTASHRKSPQVTASHRKSPQVTASHRKLQWCSKGNANSNLRWHFFSFEQGLSFYILFLIFEEDHGYS